LIKKNFHFHQELHEIRIQKEEFQVVLVTTALAVAQESSSNLFPHKMENKLIFLPMLYLQKFYGFPTLNKYLEKVGELGRKH